MLQYQLYISKRNDRTKLPPDNYSQQFTCGISFQEAPKYN